MKTIGILGGMSSASTGEYYRIINDKVNAAMGGHHSAEMIISNVDFGVVEANIRKKNWQGIGEYLIPKAKGLQEAGASCIFLATNTIHITRDFIKENTSIPFVDIIETTVRNIKKAGLKTVALLGTYPTMSEPFFREAYRELGLNVMCPTEEEMREINRIIFEELTHHRVLPTSKEYYLRVMARLNEEGAEGVILGCTEIMMLVGQKDMPNFTMFDTLDLHCEMAADICTGKIRVENL